MRPFLLTQSRLRQHTILTAFLLSTSLVAGTEVWAQASSKASRPQSVNKIIAVVNDEVITQQELNERVVTIARRLKSSNSAVPSSTELQKQVLERLISDRVQLQMAKESGMKVDDITLDRSLSKLAEENKMNLQAFRNQVEREGTPFAKFREELRDEIATQRIQDREVYSKIQVSELEVDNYLAAEAASITTGKELNLSHILILIPENANAEQIKARQARAQEVEKKLRAGEDFSKLALTYSDSGEGSKGGELGWREQSKLPASFVEAVSKLKHGEISAIVRSANGFHILKLNDERTVSKSKAESAAVQQTHARHILIKTSPIVPAAEARNKLLEIKKRIDAKTSTFADEAKASAGDASASKGGDLGWIYPGDTVPQFEEAMNKLAINEVSAPVESPFGYHLIEVLERKTEDLSKDRKRTAARQAIRESKSDEALQDWIRQTRDKAYVEYRLNDGSAPK